jgi:hypothetical protein
MAAHAWALALFTLLAPHSLPMHSPCPSFPPPFAQQSALTWLRFLQLKHLMSLLFPLEVMADRAWSWGILESVICSYLAIISFFFFEFSLLSKLCKTMSQRVLWSTQIVGVIHGVHRVGESKYV